MITSFADKETARVFGGEFSRKLPRDIQSSAQRKLIILNLLEDISHLRQQPGLNAEKLNVRGSDQIWSIRINRQWRIIFEWNENPPEASQVRIVDYH